MKKVYLVHGWGGSSDGGWFDWLKQEFKKKEINVFAFNMPDTDNPRIEYWVTYLDSMVEGADEETYFIGHSIGCQTILRYLERLPEETKVGGCIFVAGWFDLNEAAFEEAEDKEIARPWLKTPIDFEKVKTHTNRFLAIFSNNDPFVSLTNSKLFKERLGAEIIIKNNQEHFNKTNEIQEIFPFILK